MRAAALQAACAAVLVLACGRTEPTIPPDNSPPVQPSDGGTTDGGTDGGPGDAGDAGTDGGADGGTGGGTDGGVDPYSWEAVPLDDPRLRYFGRIDWSAAEGPRFSLPGVSLQLRFEGTGVAATILDHSRDEYPDGTGKQSRYALYVDGELTRTLDVTEGSHRYVLAEGLSDGAHELELFRETEGWLAEAQLRGVEVKGELRTPEAPTRRIEWVGDSIYTGYGATGTANPCRFDRTDQSYRVSYGTVASRLLGAEQRAVAASGIGVMMNRDGTDRPLASDIYGRVLPTAPQLAWTPDAWRADAVFIQLGANDFASEKLDEATFEERYLQLLEQIRAVHSEALLVVALDPVLTDWWPKEAQERTRGRAMLQRIVQRRQAAGDPRVVFYELTAQADDEMGCDYHPDVEKHEALGREVAAFLRQQLGW